MGRTTRKVVRTGDNERWTVYFVDGEPLVAEQTVVMWGFTGEASSREMSDRIRQVIDRARGA